jgi:hypothetical protein
MILEQAPLHLVRDGAYLPLGIAAADHEVIGDHQLLRDIEKDDPAGLLRRGRSRRLEGKPGLDLPLCCLG